MFAMPVGVKLKRPCRLNDGEIIPGASYELQTNGKIVFGEATGYGQGRQAAQIADGAERIRESEVRLEIGFQGRLRNRLRCGDQHVKCVEYSFHLFLQKFPDALRAQIIRG